LIKQVNYDAVAYNLSFICNNALVCSCLIKSLLYVSRHF